LRKSARFANSEVKFRVMRAIILPFFLACAAAAMAAEGRKPLPGWAGLKMTGEPENPPPFTGVPAYSDDNKRGWERALTAITSVPAIEGQPRRLGWLELGGEAMTFVESMAELKLEPFFKINRDGIETYSVEFDAEFPRRPFVYVACNESAPQGKLFKKRNVIRRLTVSGLNPPRADAASALEIISWESAGHNGCDLKFGPDGMLWASTGDGEEPGDTRYLGQTSDDLLGIVMRLDVRDASAEHPYRVPPDNPFVNVPGVTPETWCYGLRNPWKMEFNRLSGELFLCDNGEDAWEMVRLAERGGNGGWSVFEGSHPFRPHLKLQGPTLKLMKPIVEQPHTVIRSVIGGVFYHGKRHPSLAGKFVYGDYCTGTVWAFEWKNGTASAPELLANTNRSITDIGEDSAGEVLVACRECQVLKLVPAPRGSAVPTLARQLSATGLFASTKNLEPAAGCLRYDIIAPGWHDGATSSRFIALPAGSKLTASDDTWHDNFELPDGAAAVQTLVLDGRRIETRVIHRKDAEDWSFYSYAWNLEQDDADLVPADGADRFISTTADGRNAIRRHVPSRLECMMCHTWPGKRVIGLNPAQLNRSGPPGAPGSGETQLTTWQAIGLFGGARRPPRSWPRLENPADDSAPLEARSRAILHANCGHCHRPSGGGGGKPEFRLAWWYSLEDTSLINGVPLVPMFGLSDAKLIAPGDPDRSMVYRRMNTLGPGHMPLLGCEKIDDASISVIRQWIESLR
jgi:mono/diheme cytochrome c family protein